MKHYLALFFLFFLFHSAAFAAEEEPPFIAHPTNEQLYESCKEAVRLYEKKDPAYVMTACISEIRGMMGTTYTYAYKLKGVLDFEKLMCDAMDKKGFVGFDEKQDLSVYLAKNLLTLYEESLRKNKTNKELSRNANMGIIPAIFLVINNDCQKYKDSQFGVGVKNFFGE